MSELRKVYLHDGLGNPIGSFSGALNVHDADVHRIVINRAFSQQSATTTTFSSAATAGDTQIVVASATGFAVGDFIQMYGATDIEPVHRRITAITGTTFTLDGPLDNSYAIGESVYIEIINMAQIGTLASPQSFKVKPMIGEVWHLTRILIEMTHTSAGDNTYATFTNWKTNGDIVTDMYDVTYAARSGGGGAYGTNARGTFKNAGAIVYLDGTAGDYLEILIQDDISSLTSFRIKAQGHVEGS